MAATKHIGAFEESIFTQKTMRTLCGIRVKFDNILSSDNAYWSTCSDCMAEFHLQAHGHAVLNAVSANREWSDAKVRMSFIGASAV